MGKKSIETLVGLFVLLGMLGLVFLALKAANLGSFSAGDTYALTAKFDNIGGLKVRAPVRSAGVTVGRVASITLDPKTYQGVVQLEIAERRAVPGGLVGADPHVGLARRPVRRHRSRAARRRYLAAGDTIKQTQSAVVLESLIGQFLFSKAADAGGGGAGAAAPAARSQEMSRARCGRYCCGRARRRAGCSLLAGCTTIQAARGGPGQRSTLGKLEPQGLRLQRRPRRDGA